MTGICGPMPCSSTSCPSIGPAVERDAVPQVSALIGKWGLQVTATGNRGREADRPRDIPKAGWRDIAMRVKDEMAADHVSVVAAGTAFFGLLAVFPAIAAIISVAGLLLDPATVTEQLARLSEMLPQEAASILTDQARKVASGGAAVGLAAILGIAFALYGASKGVKTLMEGMNIAYDEEEDRGFVALNLVALGLTLLMIFGIVAAIAATVAVPALIGRLGFPDTVRTLIDWGRWPALAVLTMLGLAALYRFGPSRADARWRWITPGALAATVLWLVGSAAFSIYVRNFGSYNETYGAIGGVIILLTWFWLSAFIVLMGAELNSEMEHQTRRDTTTGRPAPRGERGAVKADTVGETP